MKLSLWWINFKLKTKAKYRLYLETMRAKHKDHKKMTNKWFNVQGGNE